MEHFVLALLIFCNPTSQLSPLSLPTAAFVSLANMLKDLKDKFKLSSKVRIGGGANNVSNGTPFLK